MRDLALDGPYNGLYIDPKTAEENGYTLIDWQEGEQAYFHEETPLDVHPDHGEDLAYAERIR